MDRLKIVTFIMLTQFILVACQPPEEKDILEGISTGTEYMEVDGEVDIKEEEISYKDTRIFIDGVELAIDKRGNEVKLLNYRDRTLISLRPLVDQIGSKFEWDGAGKKQRMNIITDEIKIVGTLNSNRYEIWYTDPSGESRRRIVHSETPMVEFNREVYAPLRFIGEVLKYEVEWQTDKIKLTKQKTKTTKEM